MARLNDPHRTDLSRKDLEEFPVLVWDNANEGYLPLSKSEPINSEYGNLFIKARFFVDTYIFDEYLVGYKNYYAFCIFIKDLDFMMNLNLPEFIEKDIQEIYQLLKCKPFKLFPLRYESSVIIDGHAISGYISPKEINL